MLQQQHGFQMFEIYTGFALSLMNICMYILLSLSIDICCLFLIEKLISRRLKNM